MSQWTDEQRRVLEARTRALAQAARAQAPEVQHDVVEVRVAGERLCIDAAQVVSVVRFGGVTPLPHAPPEVAGVVASGGAVVPVFYLRALLDLPLTELPEQAFALMLGAATPEVALAVDAVDRVRAVALDRLGPPPPALGAARDFVRGVDPEGVPVLDAQALLSSERLYVDIHLDSPNQSETEP